jgi:hypothetical protein
MAYPAALRADFRRFYTLDLHDLPQGMTFGQASDLAANLPPGCAAYRAAEPAASWGHTEHLLAAILYQLQAIRFMLGSGRGDRPRPIDPPKRASKPIRRIDLDGYLSRLRGKQMSTEEEQRR